MLLPVLLFGISIQLGQRVIHTKILVPILAILSIFLAFQILM